MNKELFGVDCPGCGMQRSLLLLSNGEFTQAFFMFPAIYTTLLLFAAFALHFLDKSRAYHKIIIILAIGNACIVAIAYIYKMLHL